jgi:hypothetical protein
VELAKGLEAPPRSWPPTLENMVRASQAVGVPAVVRVPTHGSNTSAGPWTWAPNGVQAPMVNDRALATEMWLPLPSSRPVVTVGWHSSPGPPTTACTRPASSTSPTPAPANSSMGYAENPQHATGGQPLK